MKKQPEFILQKQVCKYLSLAYPNVLFMSDTIASVKLTIPQQLRNKSIQKEGFKTPDLIIFEPRHGYCGMFIELKIDTPYKKNGELKKSTHLEEQGETLEQLRQRGYWADFRWSFEDVKRIIDWYLG